MDAVSANTSPTSKVIVQCTDPSNLFDVVTPLLRPRLPLSNLHWKSAARPLRSIDSLDVSFVREEPERSKNNTRHQIPGLRQTPYLKVYLLRCDDKEKYKDHVRKELKEWVKSLGISTSGKSTIKGQERHDAFEYLIVHVILPGTPAASQPKSSKHISLEASESTDSVNSTSKSKWTGKSSSTIYDKLRADFHSSSKAPFERVSQVRIIDGAKPVAILSPLELEEQWLDLVEKLKVAILQSFDTRVTQYEEDIREREAQRTLPGWNFCTFFILKEGLARGFENVGLLEDALKVYEELNAELDVVIQDQATDNYADTTNALLPYATDLKDTIRRVLENSNADKNEAWEEIQLGLLAWSATESKHFPWKLERRDYQQMILTNQVSALDFRIYIFIRQIQILLRRANVPLPVSKSKLSPRTSTLRWDADILADICERSIRFLGLAARNLKQDLFAAWGGQEGLPENERKIQRRVIDNVVASWKWSSLLQTLSDCQLVTTFGDAFVENDHDQQEEQIFNAYRVAEILKDRIRSHPETTTASGENGATLNDTSSSLHKDMFSAIHVVQGSKDAFLVQAAELFLAMRTTLVSLARGRGGYLRNLHSNDINDISDPLEVSTASILCRGVISPSLRQILYTETTTNGSYKLLTAFANQCYVTAGKFRASRNLCYDLANFEACDNQYGAAIAWLDILPSFSTTPAQSTMDNRILELYISCLRHSERFEDLSRSLFLYLGSLQQTDREEGKIQQVWTEIVESAQSHGDIDFAFDSMFAIEKVDDSITHASDAGSFGVNLSLRTLKPIHQLGHGRISLELKSRGQNMPFTVMLQYEGNLDFQSGISNNFLTSSVITEGWFEPKSLELHIGNLHFKHNIASVPDFIFNEETQFSELIQHGFLYLYPGVQSPYLTMTDSSIRNLSEKRFVSVTVFWSYVQKSISTARLRVRPATAGLRLDLRSLNECGSFTIVQIEDVQVVDFKSFGTPKTQLEIPYVLENSAISSIAVRVELSYRTEFGDFLLLQTLSTSCILPISVNVQDIFQEAATFSQFTFVPSRPIPIRIDDCSLVGCAKYQIASASVRTCSIDAFAKQPVSWIVKIKNNDRASDLEKSLGVEKDQLQLTVNYRCVDEAILETIQNAFVTSIEKSSYLQIMRPLLAHLLSRLKSIWTEHEIELATLTHDIIMWTFEEVDWTVLLHAYEKQGRAGLTQWLKDWHDAHQVIRLQVEDAPQRTLKLLVDAPKPLVMVTTSIQIQQSPAESIQLTTNRTIGQPFLAKIRIFCASTSDLMKGTVGVSVEVMTHNDLWLIGGIRQMTFDFHDSIFESDMILVPQKTGSLLLPSIDVKCRRTSDNSPIAIDTEHLSCATTIDVREGIQSTLLGIGDGGIVEGYWLVNSRAKDELHTVIG